MPQLPTPEELASGEERGVLGGEGAGENQRPVIIVFSPRGLAPCCVDLCLLP